MKKKLTRDSFSALRETAIVLDEEFQRKIQGGCTSDDHGIGYTDSGGNYHWTRTSDCDGNCWSSGSSSSSSNYGSSSEYESYSQYYNGSSSGYYGSSYSGSSSAYGTAENPIKQSDYWKLDSADRWYGGYVEGLGYVAGDSIVIGSYYGSSSGSYYGSTSDSYYGSSSYYNGSSVYGSSSFDYWSYLYGSSASGGSSSYDNLSRPSSGGGSYQNETFTTEGSSGVRVKGFPIPSEVQIMPAECVPNVITQVLKFLGVETTLTEVMRNLLSFGWDPNEGLNAEKSIKAIESYFDVDIHLEAKEIETSLKEGHVVISTMPDPKDPKGFHTVVITEVELIENKAVIHYYDPYYNTPQQKDFLDVNGQPNFLDVVEVNGLKK